MKHPLPTILFTLLLLVALNGAAAGREVRIGILARQGEPVAVERWGPTADFLSRKIPDHVFVIVPLGFAEIHRAVQRSEIDFVLANPSFYVELEKLYGVQRIATLINQHSTGRQATTFGGVIFTRADHAGIRTLADLRRRSFMAVDPFSFGGWIVAWRELARQGITPATFFSSLQFGATHDAVVEAVKSGAVDAGTVRTDTLEHMAEAGQVRLDDFLILNARQADDFPFLLSTELYPEWPFAALADTPLALSRRVAAALLTMEAADPAARASQSAGWSTPLNYQPVHDCLLELRLPPYRDYGVFTLRDVLARYWRQIIVVVLGMALVVAISLFILHLNRVLRQKKKEVEDLNRHLEERVEERTREINTLLDQEIYLREIMRTVADINALLLITAADLEELLNETCRRFVRHGDYQCCWICLKRGERVRAIYTSEPERPLAAALPYSINQDDDPFAASPSALCMREQHTIIRVVEQGGVLWTPWGERRMDDFSAVIALPLCTGDAAAHPAGSLTVCTTHHEGFQQEEVAMLEELVGDIAFAITSFRHREALKRLETERTANYEETILSFVNMIDQRDTYTAGHTQRVALYSAMIARQMGCSPRHIRTLNKAAILHDIGKIATPDAVLLKPGKLTSQEYDLIKLHAVAGFEMVSQVKMYRDLAGIIRHHHERHDGSGYPDGLRGDDIPFLARIMQVADAFDAMTTNRIYKPRKERAAALAELEKLSGCQFHPEVVRAALSVLAHVQLPDGVGQLPATELEKRRFSYFFNDKLTGFFNEDYLQIFLRNNSEVHDYKCLHSLHLKKLQEFNKQVGWEEANLFLKRFAARLQETFPDCLLFRAYGNDFVIIGRLHFAVDAALLNSLPEVSGSGIEVEVHHLDLVHHMIYRLNKLEKLEVVSQQ
ncbi:MAG: PhnD/SsuA/transferrin family substrate-binding protein [Thermodesulfobacteriota bacterium]